MIPKGHFEINLPLKIQSPRKNEIPILSKKKPILFWGSNKHKLNMKTSRWVFLLNFKQASQSPCCVIGSREKTKFSNWLMKDVIWKKECPKCDFKTSQKNYLFRHIQFHNDCGLCGKVFFGKHRKSQLATHLKTHQSPYGVIVQKVMPDPQPSKSRKKLSMTLKCPKSKCDYKTSQKNIWINILKAIMIVIIVEKVSMEV